MGTFAGSMLSAPDVFYMVVVYPMRRANEGSIGPSAVTVVVISGIIGSPVFVLLFFIF